MRMKSLSIHLRLVAVLLSLLTLPFAARAADTKALEGTVDKALAAYNAGDSKAFFADYASAVASIATDQTFKSLYEGVYKNDIGTYVSKEPIPAESVTTGDMILLVYQAKFSKADKVKLSVNFTKEGKDYKIMQISMARM